MLTLTLKNVWAHKRRLVSTFLAVFLGVAFLAGTLALGDTLRANFDNLFTQANAGTDAVVRSATKFAVDRSGPLDVASRGMVDASVIDTVRAVEGVATAAPSVDGYGQIIGRDGSAIGGTGPPRTAGNWIDDPDLNPYRIVEGRPPQADDEVVINRGAATSGDLHVGDTTTMETPQPVTVRIVGIATYGTSDGMGQVTYAGFTLSAAERYLTSDPGRVSSILVKADPGVSEDQLVQRLQPALPSGVEAITGAQLTQQDINDINATFLNLLRGFLTVFAGVALLVGAFSIYNTFSILVAQRTRESALLRALGASRRQIVRSVIAESIAVGVVASAAGLVGGIGIAGLLKAMFDAFGFSLPAGGLVFTTTSIVVPVVVGIVVTVAASVFPAMRAARVAPLAALRDVTIDRSGVSRRRAVVGLVVLGAGAALTLATALSAGSLAVIGAGAITTIVGVVIVGPVVARTAGAVLGAPVRRLRGVSGSLAQQNAMRNPRRTAATASALMVGVAVVTLFTVFAASLRASVDRTVTRTFAGDFAITTGRFGGGALSPDLATTLAQQPEVKAAAGLGRGAARIGSRDESVTIVDTHAAAQVLDLGIRSGSLADLGSASLAVSSDTARSRGWAVGTVVPVTFTDDTTTDVTIGAIYDEDTLVGGYLLPRETWAPHAVQDLDSTVYVALADGVGAERGRTAVEAVTDRFGHPDVLDRAQYVDQVTSGVNLLLGLVYVMLALAILIALMGIANTLSLSIHERTRELGLLRAVGAARGTLRAMVRWESVIIALFGAIGGLAVGLFLGWALVRYRADAVTGVFSAPVGQLVIVLIAGGVAGVVAGIRPARRAARLDVLAAIATD
jgi:putative ABC transport system permease protein